MARLNCTYQPTHIQKEQYNQMAEDKLFNSGRIVEDFAFDEQVADVFDDMLDRSIPFYKIIIDGMADLLKNRLYPGYVLYDLGCATGTTLLEMARRFPELDDIRYIGIDNARPMLDKARRKSDMFSTAGRLEFREDDITSCALPGADGIICNYTLQFLRPPARKGFVQRLYEALPDNGTVFLSEKTISHSRRLNRDFIDIYHRFKKRQGYSQLEIAAKREALENVLVPFSLQENIALLQEVGFQEVETFFTWFNFSALVAVKR